MIATEIKHPKYGVIYAPTIDDTISHLDHYNLEGVNLRNDYFYSLQRDILKRINKYSTYEYEQLFHECCARWQGIINDFAFGLFEYDVKVVIPTTCFLTWIKPGAYDLNYVVEDKDLDKTFLQSDLDEAARQIASHLPKKRGEVHMILKRGTNPGFPYPRSGRTRIETNILMTMSVSTAECGKARGWRARDALKFQEQFHGPSFAPHFERLQHSGRKGIPVKTRDGCLKTTNVAPRSRGVVGMDKMLIAWNREYVKTDLYAIMHDPHHTQDRNEILEFVRTAGGVPNGKMVGTDFKRFDKHMGGKRGEQVLHAISWTLAQTGYLGDEKTIYDDLHVEYEVPGVAKTVDGPVYVPGDYQLASGISSTTLMSCYASHTAGVAAQILAKEYGAQVNFLSWGDDMIISHNVPDDKFDEFMKRWMERIHMEVEIEPVLKYLGRLLAKAAPIYVGDDYENLYDGYALSRCLQQQFLPERPKVFPMNVIGYICRLRMLPEFLQKDYHKTMRKYWNFGCPYIEFQNLDQALKKLVELIGHDVSAAEADSILNSFTYGLDSDMIEGDLPPEIVRLLGASEIDLTDPTTALTELDHPPKRLIDLVQKFASGQFQLYQAMCTEAAYVIGRPIPTNGSVYF